MGGRGKTPLVAYLASRLIRAGERPAILSRGYGRRQVEDGVVVVSDGLHLLADLDRSGDEPLMLARAVPGAIVLVCEQRAIAAAMATNTFKASVILLDDGFQHRSMRRHVDLVIVNAEDLAARRLPFGPLREGPGALRRASAVVIDGEMSSLQRKSLPVPAFSMTRTTGQPVMLEPGSHSVSLQAGAKVVALCAIARPERFAQTLQSAGFTVTKSIAFRDHHQFSAKDVAAAAAALRQTGASAVVTTEKDAVRLLAFRPLAVPVAYVPLSVSFEPSQGFDRWCDEKIRGARA